MDRHCSEVKVLFMNVLWVNVLELSVYVKKIAEIKSRLGHLRQAFYYVSEICELNLLPWTWNKIKIINCDLIFCAALDHLVT